MKRLVLLLIILIMIINIVSADIEYPPLPERILAGDYIIFYSPTNNGLAVTRFNPERDRIISSGPDANYMFCSNWDSEIGRDLFYWLVDGNWVRQNGSKFKFGDYTYPIYESTADVKWDNEEVFFSLKGVLVQAMAKNQETMVRLVAGLIPYLIGFLIVLVGFWKAWQYLLRTLRRA